MIESFMRNLFRSLVPSSWCSNTPYLNGSVINVGDWIRKWNSLQPRKRALLSEDRPTSCRELSIRIQQPRPLLYDNGPCPAIGFAVLEIGVPLSLLSGAWRRPGRNSSSGLSSGRMRLNLLDGDYISRRAFYPRLPLSLPFVWRRGADGFRYSGFELESRRHPWLETSID